MLKSIRIEPSDTAMDTVSEPVEPLKSNGYVVPLPYGKKDASIVAMLENARISGIGVVACHRFTSRLILMSEYNRQIEAVDAEAGLIHVNYFRE